MNKKQKIVLFIGIVIFAFIGISPLSEQDYSGRQLRYPATPGIDKDKLFCYWVTDIVFFGGLWLLFSDKSKKKDTNSSPPHQNPDN
jgi:hypothetical protein